MSEFACEVVRVAIEPHPNADQIEIAKVGDYQSIVRKGQFKDGDLAVYIPEQAVVPEWLLKNMGLWDEAKQKGGLAGSAGNRVKAIKLRGVLSQGLILSGNCGDDKNSDIVLVEKDCSDENGPLFCSQGFKEGDDAAEFLGIVKYEQPIPAHMAGRIVGSDLSATHKYDFDNLKKMPTMFDDGEEVVITEKIHGTLMCVGVVPSKDMNVQYHQGRVTLASKGLGAKGFILDTLDETNLYAQAAKKHGLLDAMLAVFGDAADRNNAPIFIVGEVFGVTQTSGGDKAVQAGFAYTGEELDFRAFDICVGNRGAERYLEWDHFTAACGKLGVQPVPMLYRGPYSKQVVLDHTDGPTTLFKPAGRGKEKPAHIREGVVVKSAIENRSRHFGRKIAKSVSEAYLLRKGEVTEFQ